MTFALKIILTVAILFSLYIFYSFWVFEFDWTRFYLAMFGLRTYVRVEYGSGIERRVRVYLDSETPFGFVFEYSRGGRFTLAPDGGIQKVKDDAGYVKKWEPAERYSARALYKRGLLASLEKYQ